MLFVIYSYPGATEPAVTRRGMLTRLSPAELKDATKVERYRFELSYGVPTVLFGPANLLKKDFGEFRVELGQYYEVWNEQGGKLRYRFCLNLIDVEHFPFL